MTNHKLKTTDLPRLCLKTTGSRLKATSCHLKIRICFKTTGRQRTATGCLPAVKLRRRKLRSFYPLMRILQLQYHTNHLLSTAFRLSESWVHFVKQLADITVPNSVTEALEDSKWKEAMNEEMRALQKNGTWELVSLPHGKKTVGCRWIYTVKLKANESIEKHKTRLVAKGYTQRYRIDQETFALVAKIKTIRVLLSLAANLDWPLHQFDVKKCILTWRLGRRSIYGLATRM
ncbi:unnamed protein product [Prunus armeniaca]